jgi:DNA-binding CsgD family transcriptional regulator
MASLRTALARRPSVVLIEGDAGVGKSRLVAEWLAESGDTGVLVAACPASRTPFTLGAVVDGLRAYASRRHSDISRLGLTPLAGALRPLLPEWSEDLPPALEPAEDATAARHRLFRALAEMLDRFGVATLVLEDAHWADDATVEFLQFLATAGEPSISLVVTLRPGDVPSGSLLPRLARLAAVPTGARVELRALDVEATGRLVASMLDGQPVSEEFAHFLHDGTDGLPLAVEETMRLLRDRADVFERDGAFIRRHLDRIPLPPTIRDVVTERVGRLGEPARALLAAAAVIGRPADDALLVAVAQMPAEDIEQGLVEAVGCRLLVEADSGTVSYAHALPARVIYESVPAPTRRRLHLATARALETARSTESAVLARHFREAGAVAEWCRYGERAADLALATGDEATAISILHDLATSANLPAVDVVRLIAKFPFAALGSRALWRDLVSALRRLLAAEGLDPRVEAVVRYRLGVVLLAMYEYDEGRAHLERALPYLDREPDLAARGMVLLGWPSESASSTDEHLRWLRAANEVAERLEPADRLRLAIDRATALLMLGQADGWRESARIPLAPPPSLRPADAIRANFNIGDQATVWGRYNDARTRLVAAATLAEQHGYVRLQHLVRASQVHLDWFLGEWGGLDERVESLLGNDDLAPGTQMEVGLVGGLHDIATGRYDRARQRLEGVIEGWRDRGAVQLYPEAAAALSAVLLEAGDVEAALRLTADAYEIVVGKGMWLWATEIAPARATALITSGDLNDARAVVTVVAAGLAGRTVPAANAGLILCRAMIAEANDDVVATELYGEAAAAWAALPRPYDALRANERRAACLLRADATDEALSELQQVLSGFEHLGATYDARRVVRSLRERGVEARTATWRGGRRGYGDQLSPREAEVVRLVIAGRTNRQVAQALSRSPHTVDSQLRSAMRKLGVSSRAALAARAIELDVLAGGS